MSVRISVRAAFWALVLGIAVAQMPLSVEAQQREVPDSLELAAWNALEAGQNERAAAIFRDALAIDPNSPTLHVGAAAAAYGLGRNDEARVEVDRALALNPKQPLARELDGRLRYRSGDVNGAVQVFESLVAEGRTALGPTLDRWKREAELRGRMFMAAGAGVSVEFEGPNDETLAREVLASIERASSRITAVLGHIPFGSIPIVLYTNEQFSDITQSPSWAGGAFDGTIRIPMRGALANPAELDRVIAHEYTHALIHDIAPRGLPTWFSEGLAAMFEKDNVPSPSRPMNPVRLQAMEKSFGNLSRAQARDAYATSAFAVAQMLNDAGIIGILRLLGDVADGVPFEQAFSQRMPRTLEEFETDLASPPAP